MRQVKINGVYKHFKGNYYIVVDIARDTETLEEYEVKLFILVTLNLIQQLR